MVPAVDVWWNIRITGARPVEQVFDVDCQGPICPAPPSPYLINAHVGNRGNGVAFSVTTRDRSGACMSTGRLRESSRPRELVASTLLNAKSDPQLENSTSGSSGSDTANHNDCM